MTFSSLCKTLGVMAKRKMGRPKLERPTTQKRLNLAYMHLLEPLRKKLTPRGVELSDSQLIDTCVATVHGLLLEEGVEVCDPVRMMANVNRQFRNQFVESMVKVLGELGHTNIRIQVREDQTALVTCDAGEFTVPAQMFARADADSMFRDMKTPGVLPS